MTTTTSTSAGTSLDAPQLAHELKLRTLEIKELREKLAHYQRQSQHSMSHTNAEVETIKRDKSIAVGLVNTMQKDLSNKDSTISKLAREIEGYKRELHEREHAYADLLDKYNEAVDPNRVDEAKINTEKELTVLRAVFIEQFTITQSFVVYTKSDNI